MKTINTEVTYRLVDVQGYIDHADLNYITVEDHPEMKTGFVLDDVTDEGYGMGWDENVEYDFTYMYPDEYKFFEIIK